MADIQNAIRKHLKADANITAIVGAKLFNDVLGQETTVPAIVVEEISNVSHEAIDGDVCLEQTRLRIKSYSDLSTQAATLRDLAKDRVKGLQGTIEGVLVMGSGFSGKGNGVDEPVGGDDEWRRFKWLDVVISHES